MDYYLILYFFWFILGLFEINFKFVGLVFFLLIGFFGVVFSFMI